MYYVIKVKLQQSSWHAMVDHLVFMTGIGACRIHSNCSVRLFVGNGQRFRSTVISQFARARAVE